MTPRLDFVGWQAVILHKTDEGIDRLVRQLGLLGLAVDVRWEPYDPGESPADILLIDADQGWPGLLPFEAGLAPMPIVALLQSEAPGRIAYALDQGAGAIIAKPIAASAVYPALVLATAAHEARVETARRIDRLEERLRLRPLVHSAVVKLAADLRLSEDAAYQRLRLAAMQRRVLIEQIAADLLAGTIRLPEAG